MNRKIVLVRHQEPLHHGWSKRSFDPAASHIRRKIKVSGTSFDESFSPVRLVGRFPGKGMQPTERPVRMVVPGMGKNTSSAYVVRAQMEDEDAAARLAFDRREEVLGVFADVPIGLAPSPGDGPPVGDSGDVARKLGVAALARAGCTGRNTRIAIVDSGVDGTVVPVAGGWSPLSPAAAGYLPPGGVRAGEGDWQHHGTMCAYDARIAAPEAAIYDYRLMTGLQDKVPSMLSDAVAAFAELYAFLQAHPGPLIVSNSWCLFDRADDAPVGSPENYCSNLNHPFNRIVSTLVGAGADVLFAAGNCGIECPNWRCGPNDVGCGNSIHGASSHPDVLTVAAVTIHEERLGYSSQGPGGIALMKPDLCGYSHFEGSGLYAADVGTSAACPVVAGVVAALRQRASSSEVTPPQLKAALQRTARDLGGVGFDYDYGYGVIDPPAAMAMLGMGDSLR